MNVMLNCRMRRAVLVMLVGVAVAAPASSTQQDEPSGATPDPWNTLRFLVGRWEGTGEGRWGHSTVEREYEFVLGGAYLFARNKSVYPPQEKNPGGEVHTDWSMVSFDKQRATFVLRQFHDEAFVNRYVLEAPAGDGKTLVFTTEHIENFIPGWRARETYRVLTEDAFEEVFDLAPPEGEFKTYITNRFERVQ
ncbi:MAG: hypothetical protein ACYS0G_16365 [Planctomycetota bacterium]|jgi:hypothetical protein